MLIGIAMLFVGLGCGGDDTSGGGMVDATMNFAAFSSDVGAVELQGTAAPVQVTEAWFAFGDVTLTSRVSDCAGDDSVAGGLDARNLAVMPAEVRPFIAAGPQCRVRARVVHAPSSAPSGVAGNSVVLTGALSGTPFTVTLAEEVTLELYSASGFEVTQAPLPNYFLLVDLAVLLGSSLQEASPDGGAITINESQNATVHAEIRGRLESSWRLVRDSNGDNVLGADEALVPLAVFDPTR